jgi:NADH-quinone oxidoreductase subunit A
MYFDFATIVVFFLVAIGFVFGALLVGRFLRPNLPDPQKSIVYECGERPIGSGWFNFNPRFYLMALVFIIFDVEIALTYPVAVVAKKWIASGRALSAVMEIILFIGILAAALVFVWAKGHLDWARDVESPEDNQ